jgi:putative ABC transport system permease protein
VFAAGIRGSIDSAIAKTFQGDLLLQNQDSFSPIPAAAPGQVGDVEGVEAVSSLIFKEANVRETGERSFVSGIDPNTVRAVLEFDWKEGSDATLSTLGRRDALVEKSWAEDNGIDVGDTIHLTTPTGKHVAYLLEGSFEDDAYLYGDFVVTSAAMRGDFGEHRPFLTFIKLAGDADPAAVRERLDALVDERFPVVDLLDQAELKEKQADQINQLVGLLYALLSLAVVVSLFGIVNTLTLSIYERTRELGLLRAIGMSRAQVRRVVRYESVITALIGAVLGSLLGVFFAVIVSRPLADEGFILSFPVGTLLVLLVLAAIAGVLAAILPARRASRLDVLEALAYE